MEAIIFRPLEPGNVALVCWTLSPVISIGSITTGLPGGSSVHARAIMAPAPKGS
jgi:hypothetical protein